MKKYLVSGLLFVFFLEILLQFVGVFDSYTEKTSGEYYSQYRQSKPSWFHTWQPNSTVKYVQEEFEYLNKYNDIGHRELDFSSFCEDTLTEKIICLGDSFTEGDGAPADSTWVKRLNYRLNQEIGYEKYRLYNAGVCGSDVFFNNRMLMYTLMALKPKVVIECVNFSDIYDVIWRGGEERFNNDGSTSGKVGPTWERFYKYSHVFRAFVRKIGGYDSNLTKVEDLEKNKEVAHDLIKKQVDKTARFCQEKKVKYILLIHPSPSEIRSKETEGILNSALFNSSYVINLFKPMMKFYEINDISKYSWRINGHFNSKGYEIMGNMVFEELSLINILE